MKIEFPLYWIPLLPLLGAAFNILVGRKLSRPAVHIVACGTVFASLIVTLVAVFNKLYPLWSKLHKQAGDGLMATPALTNKVFDWITAGTVNVELGFIMDPLTAVMVCTVTFVGFLIHLYSTGYMSHERDYARYFGYLNLFTGAMLTLVLGDNLLVLFVGWEGVGVCSYLLIGFWFNKSGTKAPGDDNASAGRKAFVVNRIGDFAFILGMFLLFATVGTLNIEQISQQSGKLLAHWNPFGNGLSLNIFVPGLGSLAAGKFDGLAMMLMVIVGGAWLYFKPGFLRLVGLIPLLGGWGWSILAGFTLPTPDPITIAGAAAILLLIGACGKSAQIPLYIWLPDAMAGPTPVSALIHAATMVTAGVYMIARLNFLYMLSPFAMGVVALIGAATALFAATIGFAQNDIKKVLAYSTISQLGYMFLAVGVGAYAAGVFHLFTHAFFKACLFLGAGAVIHAMSGKQDIREMGGLNRKMPITHMTFLISCLAIAGVPLFAGFFSKDEILWKTITTGNPVWPPWFPVLLYVMGLAGAICTAFYMFRLYYLTFSGENRADETTRSQIHEQVWNMTVPLIVLAGGATVLGFLGLPGVVGKHANLFHNWLAPVTDRGALLAEAKLGAGRVVGENAFAHNHGLEIGLMVLSVAVALGSIMVARMWYKGGATPKVETLVAKIPRLHRLVLDKYRVDELYQVVIGFPLRWIGMFLWKGTDEMVIETGVNGAGWISRFASDLTRRLQNGSLQRYLVGLVAGVGVIIFFTTYPPSNFSITPGAKVKVGTAVQFDATRKVTVDARQLTYRWDYDGDGKWDTEALTEARAPKAHRYDKPGKYEVRLQVRDLRWRTVSTKTRMVEVMP